MLRQCKRSVNPTIDYGRPVDVTADDNDVKKGGKTRQKEREEEDSPSISDVWAPRSFPG